MKIKELCAISSITLAACASYPQPTDNLASSVGAVRGAQEAGAEQLPDAALHLRLAQEQNEAAKQLMADGENERATYMTERARADAELAVALAHQERARKRAREASLSPTPEAQPAAPGPMPGATPETNKSDAAPAIP